MPKSKKKQTLNELKEYNNKNTIESSKNDDMKTTEMNNEIVLKQFPKKRSMDYINIPKTRQITFCKRKNELIKKANELDKLTRGQILLLIVSETDILHYYASDKMKPIVEDKSLLTNIMNKAFPDSFSNHQKCNCCCENINKCGDNDSSRDEMDSDESFK